MAAAAAESPIRVGDYVQNSSESWPKACKVLEVTPDGRIVFELLVGGRSGPWRPTELKRAPHPECTKRKRDDSSSDDDDEKLKVGDRVRLALNDFLNQTPIGSTGTVTFMSITGCDVNWDHLGDAERACQVDALERIDAKKKQKMESFKAGDRVRATANTSNVPVGSSGTIIIVYEGACEVDWDEPEGKNQYMLLTHLEHIYPAAAAASSSAAAAAASLDGTDAKWITIEPAYLATHELYHERLQCGVKVSELDLVRTNSEYIQTLLKDCTDTKKRLLVPDAAFQSAERMHDFFKHTFTAYAKISPKAHVMVEFIHAASAMDLLDAPLWKNALDSLIDIAPDSLSYADQVELGARYHKPTLIASGAHAFAKAWKKMTAEEKKAVPDHLRLRCATHIMESHGAHCNCRCK